LKPVTHCGLKDFDGLSLLIDVGQPIDAVEVSFLGSTFQELSPLVGAVVSKPW
jgi:hypothetical protein